MELVPTNTIGLVFKDGYIKIVIFLKKIEVDYIS
jgi:hypothetical protein